MAGLLKLSKEIADLRAQVEVLTHKRVTHIVTAPHLEGKSRAESVSAAIDAVNPGPEDYVAVKLRGGGMGFFGPKPKQVTSIVYHTLPGAERKPMGEGLELPKLLSEAEERSGKVQAVVREVTEREESQEDREERWKDHMRRIRHVRFNGEGKPRGEHWD
jgi:hypothetical protein